MFAACVDCIAVACAFACCLLALVCARLLVRACLLAWLGLLGWLACLLAGCWLAGLLVCLLGIPEIEVQPGAMDRASPGTCPCWVHVFDLVVSQKSV